MSCGLPQSRKGRRSRGQRASHVHERTPDDNCPYVLEYGSDGRLDREIGGTKKGIQTSVMTSKTRWDKICKTANMAAFAALARLKSEER